ncbi:MAG: helix-hairpin-helix domain-containing protein [Erysipelotrichaceae bacterium]|jgi:uncharacterized protein
MEIPIINDIASQLNVASKQVEATLEILQEGGTVPFIARYRKDATGGLDEEQILFIEKQYKYQINLEERKLAVISLIEQQGKLTEEIRQSIMECTKLSQVEDLYQPYKQKRKTRAAVAIKNGLQPLADYILTLPVEDNLNEIAQQYLNENVLTVDDAIAGASDIIAEIVSDNAKLRWSIKDQIVETGSLQTKIKDDAVDEKKVYEMYYDRTEKITSLADHRIMAINRAEKEKVISVTFIYDLENIHNQAIKIHCNKECAVKEIIDKAVIDGCNRLLLPSIENEIRSDLSDRAHTNSIEVFSMNLEKLLSQPPLKGRVVLGFDPGYYNGCKLAVLNETGKMLTVEKVFPFSKKGGDLEQTKKRILDLINKYKVKIIAIGNGTASRESEKLVAEIIEENKLDVAYAIVSEAGASVWSAQEDARNEFPDLAVEDRSAISIGRRLLDPLSELIKIDPKSIGVGQYQHDLPEKALSERLQEATMKIVNRVGADVNTASVELLSHISGLNTGVAKEIVSHRNENGKFTNRNQLLNVKRLGPKSFTQCAGFLRIIDGEEPLDATNIHPESYDDAKKLMKVCDIKQLGQKDISFPKEKVETLNIEPFTLKDIQEAIKAPLRDYREQFEGAILKSDVLEISDLHVGDKLDGTVRNVVDFGAFVDIGLHEDGLVHISRMSMTKISHPSDVVAVNDIVQVYVCDIDLVKSRVQLSLLPLEKLEERDNANRKAFKDRKKSRNRKPVKTEKEKQEEAMKRLLERFGKDYQ